MLTVLRSPAIKDVAVTESPLTLTHHQEKLPQVKVLKAPALPDSQELLESPKVIMKRAKLVNSEVVRLQESPDLHVSPVSSRKVRSLDLPVSVHQESPANPVTLTCLPVSHVNLASPVKPVTLTHHPAHRTLNRPATLMTTIVKIDLLANTRETMATMPTEVETEVVKVSPEATEVVTVVEIAAVIAVVIALVVSTAVATVALMAKTRVPTLVTRDSQDVKVTTTSPEVVEVRASVVVLPEAVSPSTVSSLLLSNESRKCLRLLQ